MAILYKGYAQQKGFGANLVKVPDPADRIRRQGLETLRGMQDQVDWNNQQATRLINTLEQNAQIEAKNRADNFKLRQSFSESIHRQKQSNLQALHEDARRRQAAKKEDFKNLLALTQKGAQLWQAYDAKQKQDADIWAHQNYDEHGIGWEKHLALKNVENEIWQDSAQRELLLQKLGLDGVPDDVIDRVRSVSGYRAVALAKHHARRWARDTGLYYAENMNTMVEIAGMQVNLNDAQGDQVHTVLQLLDAKRRREAGENAPSAKALSLAGGYQMMDNARASVLANKTRDAQTRSVERQWEDEMTFLKDAIAPQDDGIARPGVGIENLIKYYAGGDIATRKSMRSARHRVVSAIIHGLETNQLDWEDIKDLENHPMEIGGANKTFSDFFEREWESIRAAGVQGSRRDIAKAQLGQQANQIKDQKFLSELHQLAAENPDSDTWAKMLAIANAPQNNYSESARFISDVMVRGQNAANDAEGMAVAQGWVSRGEHISPEMIQGLKVTPGTEAQIRQLAAKNNKFMPTPGDTGTEVQLNATIDGLLKHLIPATVLDDKSDVRLAATIQAKILARNHYKGYTASGMSHAEALLNTQKFIKDKILDKEGLWAVTVDQSTGRHVFAGFHADGEWVKIDIDDNGMIGKFANNHDIMHSTPLINKEDLEKKSTALNNNQQQDILLRSTFLESAIGHTPNSPKALEIEMAQIEYHNSIVKESGKGTLIKPYPDWYIDGVNKTYAKFSPRAQRLLNNWGYCDINRAACESGMNPIYNKPAVTQAQNVLSIDDDYTRTDKGKLDNITTLSLREIITSQENEKYLLAGRYGFDRESLAEAAELAGISLDDKFSVNVQDKLFEAYFKANGMKLVGGVEDPQERLLLESAYRLMTEEKLGPLGFNEPVLLRPQAFKAKVEGGFYG